MPAWPMTDTKRRPLLAPGGVEQVLEQAQLLVAADERRLEALGPIDAAELGHDAQGPPRRDRATLALEQLLAGRLVGDRRRGRAVGRLADQHAARRRRTPAAGWRC